MSIFKKWFNKANLQSFLLFFDLHPNPARQEYEFEPWFQYKTGPPEKGPVLYFRKQPNKEQYKNGIFSKMRQYSGNDLAQFLDYHFTAFPNKNEFVRFLRYEILERSKGEITQESRLNLETALEWVKEKEPGIQLMNAATSALPDPAGPTDHLPSGPTRTFSNGAIGHLPADPVGISAEQEKILSEFEMKMNDISRSYAGKIVLNNQHHLEKLIHLLLLLKDLRAPGKKVEQLFEHFTAMDMAAILRQLEEFGDQRTNTLQVKVMQANNTLRPNDPKVKKLIKALTDFFFS